MMAQRATRTFEVTPPVRRTGATRHGTLNRAVLASEATTAIHFRRETRKENSGRRANPRCGESRSHPRNHVELECYPAGPTKQIRPSGEIAARQSPSLPASTEICRRAAWNSEPAAPPGRQKQEVAGRTRGAALTAGRESGSPTSFTESS